MRSWTKSEIYPTWISGNGIHRSTITGPYWDRTYSRKYNKIGSFLGINFVADKDRYETVNFGFSPIEEGSDVGTWAFSRIAASSEKHHKKVFDYAYERMHLTQATSKLPIGSYAPTEEDVDVEVEGYRPPRVSTDIDYVPILLSAVGIVAIIILFK